MRLDDSVLYKRNDELMKMKTNTYEKIYTKCKNTIALTANAGELVCLFEIPRFVLGVEYPIIDVEPCRYYIQNKLYNENKNIKTKFIKPNLLFIDWRR